MKTQTEIDAAKYRFVRACLCDYENNAMEYAIERAIDNDKLIDINAPTEAEFDAIIDDAMEQNPRMVQTLKGN